MTAPVPSIDLVLFEIGGVRYAADLTQVRRIGQIEYEQSVGYPLGKPSLGTRALVFTGRETEAQLAIDAVLGVHTVPIDDLRRLPLAVSTSSALTIGAWVNEGSQTVLIIDLHATTLPSSRGSE